MSKRKKKKAKRSPASPLRDSFFPTAYKKCRRCQRTITREEFESKHHCKNHRA